MRFTVWIGPFDKVNLLSIDLTTCDELFMILELTEVPMPALREFIVRLGAQPESICSSCCQVVRPTPTAPTLEKAQQEHRCGEFSLNTTTR